MRTEFTIVNTVYIAQDAGRTERLKYAYPAVTEAIAEQIGQAVLREPRCGALLKPAVLSRVCAHTHGVV